MSFLLRTRVSAGLLLLAATAAVVSGCMRTGVSLSTGRLFGGEDPNAPILPPASLPRYGVGDAFAFDDGRAYTVVAVDGDRITWTAGDDYRYVARPDFVLPSLSWTWIAADGERRQGTAIQHSPPDSLWPLKVGKTTRFTSIGTFRRNGGSASESAQWWTCEVAGTETVAVPAGTFDCFKIECDRHDFGSWVERLQWDYAPRIGHFVKRVQTYPNAGSREIRLVAYGPRPVALPEPVRVAREATVQKALERNRRGKTETARVDSTAIAVTPTRTFRTESGTYCRTYRQELTARGRTSTQEAVACRDRHGVWGAPARTGN